MTVDTEKQLLNLSLEMMAARDPLAAGVAFGRFLQQRCKPQTSECLDANHEHFLFSPNSLHYKKGRHWYFLLDLAIPKIFVLGDCRSSELSEHELDTISKIVKLFRQNLDVLAELKGLSYTDDITGLYNHRYLEVVLDREFSLARRNGSPFVVLFLDLDHFKKINDNYGHLIGSRLLTEVGEEVKRTLRESDITFRYGGDEFVMVLTQTNIKDGMMVAERIRQKIEKKRFLARESMDIRLTASIGVAAFPEHAESTEQILKAADTALYSSKKETRNRVVTAPLEGIVT